MYAIKKEDCYSFFLLLFFSSTTNTTSSSFLLLSGIRHHQTLHPASFETVNTWFSWWLVVIHYFTSMRSTNCWCRHCIFNIQLNSYSCVHRVLCPLCGSNFVMIPVTSEVITISFVQNGLVRRVPRSIGNVLHTLKVRFKVVV